MDSTMINKLFMKYIILFFVFIISLQSFSQNKIPVYDIDKNVDEKLAEALKNIPTTGFNEKIDSAVKAQVNKILIILTYDTVIQRKFSSPANVDTLTAPNNSSVIYEILICGSASILRNVAVTNNNGVYSSRYSDDLSWSGVTGSKLSSTTTTRGIVILTVGTNGFYIYQRQRKNL